MSEKGEGMDLRDDLMGLMLNSLYYDSAGKTVVHHADYVRAMEKRVRIALAACAGADEPRPGEMVRLRELQQRVEQENSFTMYGKLRDSMAVLAKLEGVIGERATLTELRGEVERLRQLGLERLEWRSRMGLTPSSNALLERAEQAESALAKVREEAGRDASIATEIIHDLHAKLDAATAERDQLARREIRKASCCTDNEEKAARLSALNLQLVEALRMARLYITDTGEYELEDCENTRALIESALKAAGGEAIMLDTGSDSPWPVREVLKRLADMADHMLSGHDCDNHGWEGVSAARDAARSYLKAAGEGR